MNKPLMLMNSDLMCTNLAQIMKLYKMNFGYNPLFHISSFEKLICCRFRGHFDLTRQF